MVITKNQREILEHTAFRAANRLYCGDSVTMQELVGLGLMVSCGRKPFVLDEYFALTRKGCKVLDALIK